MAERLVIDNFVGIDHIELEFNRINILIGPQATGKSICAKLLFYFSSFVDEIETTVEKKETKRNLDARLVRKFNEYFPSSSWGDSEFIIEYSIGDAYIKVIRLESKSTKIKIEYSDHYRKLLQHFRYGYKKYIKEMSEEDGYHHRTTVALKDMFNETLSKDFGNGIRSFQLFIPAGRSFFAILQSGIFSFLSTRKALDPFLIEFGSFYERIKRFLMLTSSKRKRDTDVDECVEKLVSKIIVGNHIIEKGEDFLVSGKRKINLAISSSGQQESLPLAIILRVLLNLKFPSPRVTVYIEEPEAHIFPTGQKHLVELISTIFNSSVNNIRFVITTHSPYILTAFNNLIQAGMLGRVPL